MRYCSDGVGELRWSTGTSIADIMLKRLSTDLREMPRLALFIQRGALYSVHYALREVARKRGTSGSGANSQLRTRRQGCRAGGSGGRCVLSGRRVGLSWGKIRNNSSMPPCQHVSQNSLGASRWRLGCRLGRRAELSWGKIRNHSLMRAWGIALEWPPVRLVARTITRESMEDGKEQRFPARCSKKDVSFTYTATCCRSGLWLTLVRSWWISHGMRMQ
jgi:hypothetical protein